MYCLWVSWAGGLVRVDIFFSYSIARMLCESLSVVFRALSILTKSLSIFAKC